MIKKIRKRNWLSSIPKTCSTGLEIKTLCISPEFATSVTSSGHCSSAGFRFNANHDGLLRTFSKDSIPTLFWYRGSRQGQHYISNILFHFFILKVILHFTQREQ